MASKRHQRRVRCANKQAYPNVLSAGAAAASLNRRSGYAAIEPYRCAYCGRFHVGHRRGVVHEYQPKRTGTR